jgi:hypothetical protein
MKLYKYLSRSATNAVLSNKTLQVSSADCFNDPFDMSMQSFTSREEFSAYLIEMKNTVCDLLFDESKTFSSNPDLESNREQILAASKVMSKQELESFKESIKSSSLESLYGDSLPSLFQKQLKTYKDIKEELDSWGILCLSSEFDNLLLWSHYAEDHKGVVLEFSPSVEKDSFLLAGRNVFYTPNRPVCYNPKYFFSSPNEQATELTVNDVIYNKHPLWSYEKEYRVAFPNFCKEQSRVYIPFLEEDLSAIYLGSKTSQEDKEKYIKLAKQVNPNVAIYEMSCDTTDFKLNRREYK